MEQRESVVGNELGFEAEDLARVDIVRISGNKLATRGLGAASQGRPRNRRVLASNRVEAGRTIHRTSSMQPGEEASSLRLSLEESEKLQTELADIAEAQRVALMTGSTHYVGVRP